MIPPEELKRNKGWVAIDGKVYNLSAAVEEGSGAGSDAALESAKGLLEKWGGKSLPREAVGSIPKELLDFLEKNALVDDFAKEISTAELAKNGWIAFHGGVFDLDEFAVGHPGGSELITDWKGKDGTAALLDAHPGGQAMIRSTLNASEFAAAYKGSFPYVRKKRRVVVKKRKGGSGSKHNSILSPATARVLLTVVLPTVVAVVVALNLPESLQFRPTDVLPADWPTKEHLIHLAVGAVIAITLRSVAVKLNLIQSERPARPPTSSTKGAGVGGWTYGDVTPALVQKIRAVCADDGQVFTDDDGEDGQRELSSHSRDMSFHKRAKPDVVVYPLSPEEVRVSVCVFDVDQSVAVRLMEVPNILLIS